eukprot:TRINITY_DN64538_c0_g1_i1.p3 TRINITY_DN64538_c0_g1~~TRINITY_DN64538_c0_g1_i1.p3  ORF type:complete len:105 (-),score=26.11 TRINITY_DN64538_c0_g1_i1:15-329(-)
MGNRGGGEDDEEVQENFWAEMSTLEWCPVLSKAPEKGMPWMDVQQVVAMPRSIRPIEDAWKVSYSMRILEGGCRQLIKSQQYYIGILQICECFAGGSFLLWNVE